MNRTDKVMYDRSRVLKLNCKVQHPRKKKQTELEL